MSTWAGTFGGGGGGGFGGGAGGGAGAGNGGWGAAYGSNAAPNTGSGGGGGGNMDAFGGNGGSGIVVIKYLTVAAPTAQSVNIRGISAKTVTQTVALTGSGLDQPYYQATYSDLNAAFGGYLPSYWDHFQQYGFLEGRAPYSGAYNEGSAYAQSGMPVTFSVVSGPALINGSTLSFNGSGTVVLRATQAGGTTAITGRTFASAYADTSFTVTNQNPTNTTSILNGAKAILATSPTASIDIAFGDTFYIRVTGSDPEGRLGAFYSRITFVSGAAWDYPQVSVSGGSASYDFGPYNTANAGGIGLANVWTHVQDLDAGGYVWQGNGWWGSDQPDVNIVKATPTGTFANATKTPQGGTTFIVNTSDLNATFANPYSGTVAAPTGAVVYSIAPGSPNGSIGNTITPGIYPLTAGLMYWIRASYPGDTNYNATGVDSVWTIGKVPQPAVTITSAASVNYGTGYTATASGGAGTGALVWTLVGGTAPGSTINSSTGAVTCTGPGTVLFNCYRSGDANYNPSATTSNFTLTFTLATPVITSGAMPSAQVGVFYSYQITATNNPTSFSATGLPPGLSINTSTGVISGTPTTAGSYTVTISATNAAGTGLAVGFGLTVAKGTQPAVTITSATSVNYGVGYTATASGGAGTGAWVWTLVAGGTAPGAAINSSTGVVTTTGTGTVFFNCYRAYDTNYNQSATTATFTLSVNSLLVQAPLTLTSATSFNYGQSYTATTGGGSTAGAVTFALGSGSTASGAAISSSGVVTSTSAGTVVFVATKAGDATYNPRSDTFTVTINKIAQPTAVVVTSSSSGVYGTPYTVTASGGNAGTYSYAVVGGTALGPVINASTGVVTTTSSGTVIVNATRSGDTIYSPATSVNFVVTLAARPITVTLAGSKTYDLSTMPTGASASITSGNLAYTDTIGYAFAATSSANVNSYSGLTTATVSNAAAPTTRTGSYAITYTGSYAITKANQGALTIYSSNTVQCGKSYVARVYQDDNNNDGYEDGAGPYVWSLGTGSTATGAAIDSSSGAVTFTSIGSVVFKCYRTGDANYNQSATTGEFTLNVTKGQQSPVSIISYPDFITYGSSFTATATGGSGTGSFVWSVVPGDTDALGAAINASTGAVSYTSTGRVGIACYKAGDANFYQSPTVGTFSLMIDTADQPAVTISSPASTSLGAAYTATATGGAGTGALFWTLVPGGTASGAAINSSTGAVTTTGTGTVFFNVYKAADDNYNQSATSGNFTLTITPAPATIPQTALLVLTSAPTVGVGTSYTATASGGDGTGAITWVLGSGSTAPGAAISSGGVVTFTGAGTVIFRATKAGDSIYSAKASDDFTLTVGAAQIITFNAMSDVDLATTQTTTATASSNVGLPITFTYDNPAVVSGINTSGVVTLIGAGQVKITATQAGNGTYGPASASQILNVIPPGTAGGSANGYVTLVSLVSTGNGSSGNVDCTIKRGDGTTWLSTTVYSSLKTGSTRTATSSTYTGDTGGTLVAQSTIISSDMWWGTEEVTQTTTAGLTTQYQYYTDQNYKGSFRRLYSVKEPTGNWVKYEYYEDWDKRGQLKYEFHPFLDAPNNISANVTTGRVISYDYKKNWDDRFTRPDFREEKVNNVRVAYSTYAVVDEPGGNGYWPSEALSVTAYANNSLTQTSTNSNFRADAGLDDPGRPYYSIGADGTKTSFNEEVGGYDWATHTFAITGSPEYFRTLAAHGSNSNADGNATLMTKYDDNTRLEKQQLHSLWMTPNKSTVDICIYKAARKLREETWIYTGSGFSMVGWTDYEYDYAGRLLTSKSSNDPTPYATPTTKNIYTQGLLTTSIDATGIETNYRYDLIGRPVAVIKKGIAGQTYDIVTTKTYDGAGRTTKVMSGGILTASTAYNLAGLVSSNTVPGGTTGYTTTYDYALGGRQVTVTPSVVAPDLAGTIIKESYLDGSPKSVLGTGVIAQTHEHAVDSAAGYARMKHTSYAGGLSTSATVTYTDMLGRPVEQRSPGYNGGADIVQTSVYDTKGHLVRSTQTGAPDALYVYDVLGQVKMQGTDLGTKNGVLDLDSEERITAQDSGFAYDTADSAWYAVSTKSVYAQSGAGATTPTVVGKTETQLNNLPAGAISRTKVTDIYGNQTISVTTLDKANKKVTTTTTASDSNTPGESISVNGLLQSSKDTAGIVTSYGYDALGRQTTVTDAQGRTITTAYKANSAEISTVTDAVGVVQKTYAYDTVGRVKSVGVPDPKNNGTMLYTYYEYDIMGRKVHEWGNNTVPVEIIYDTMGRQWKMNTFAKVSYTNFTTSGWPSGAAVAATATTTWNYDPNTSLVISKVEQDAQNATLNKTVSFVYTPENKLWKTTNARGQITTRDYSTTTGELTDEKYFAADGTTSIATPIHYDYNRLGQLKGVQDDAGTRAFTYNSAGTLELQNEEFTAGSFLGQLATYKVQTGLEGKNGRATEIDFGTTGSPANAILHQKVEYDYKPDGRLASITSGGNQYTYTYRTNSDLIDKGTLGNYTDIRGYDNGHDWSKNRKTTFGGTAANIASFTHTFDKVGHITNTAKAGTLFEPYAASGAGLTTTYAYSDRDEVIGEKTAVTGGAALPGRDNLGTVADPGFKYDTMGNREKTNHNGAVTGYETNALNRYTNVAVPGIYDVAGYTSQPSVTVTGTGTAGSQGATNKANNYFFTSYLMDNSSAAAFASLTINDGLGSQSAGAYLQPRTFVIQYDADGNMTDDGKWFYTYNLKNQLVSIRTSDTAIAKGAPRERRDFTYDYLGRRIKKGIYVWMAGQSTWVNANNEFYLYDGWNLAVTLDGSLNKRRSYVWGLDLSGSAQGAGGVGGLLMVQDGGGVYLPAYDTNGNVHGLVTLNSATFYDANSNPVVYAAGSLVANYEYDAFGNTLREDGPYAASNPFRFSTKYTDVETDLVYYGLRYYNPSLGRFINTDPIEEAGGLNLYSFCGNDGVNGIDYLGMGDPSLTYTRGGNGSSGTGISGWGGYSPTLYDLTPWSSSGPFTTGNNSSLNFGGAAWVLAVRGIPSTAYSGSPSAGGIITNGPITNGQPSYNYSAPSAGPTNASTVTKTTLISRADNTGSNNLAGGSSNSGVGDWFRSKGQATYDWMIDRGGNPGPHNLFLQFIMGGLPEKLGINTVTHNYYTGSDSFTQRLIEGERFQGQNLVDVGNKIFANDPKRVFDATFPSDRLPITQAFRDITGFGSHGLIGKNQWDSFTGDWHGKFDIVSSQGDNYLVNFHGENVTDMNSFMRWPFFGWSKQQGLGNLQSHFDAGNHVFQNPFEGSHWNGLWSLPTIKWQSPVVPFQSIFKNDPFGQKGMFRTIYQYHEFQYKVPKPKTKNQL